MKNANSLKFLFVALLILFNGTITHSETLVITNATLIDGTGSEPVKGINIITNGKYIEIVNSGSLKELKAEGVKVINAGGRTVIPGLIDTHTHPSMEIRTKTPKWPFPAPDTLISNDKELREFLDTRMQKRLDKFLAGGVTTAVSLGHYWPVDIELRDQLLAGERSGPRLFVSSPIFTAPGGHPASGICNGASWCAERLSVQVDTEEAARKNVQHFSAGGAQGIKLVYDSFDRIHFGGPNLKFPRLDKRVVAAIIDEAKHAGIPVIAHAKTVGELSDISKLGIDALAHSAFMENTLLTTDTGEYLPQSLQEKGLSMSTTIAVFHKKLLSAPPGTKKLRQRNFDRVSASLRAYADAGVNLMLGTDFDGKGLDPDPGISVQNEAVALVAAGFSEQAVIAMATGNAAQHPMVPDTLGTIAPGKIADLLILAEDPLKDITAIAKPLMVIQSGQIVVDKR